MKKGPHFGGYCKECGSLKKWVPKKDVDSDDVRDSFNTKLF